jgi:diguanylate cyclase (GGDEF)-like protein
MTDALIQVSGSELVPILNSAFDGIAILSPVSWRIVYLNPTLRGWLDQRTATRADQSVRDLVLPAYRDALKMQLDETLKSGEANPSPVITLQLNLPEAHILSARCCRLELGGQPLLGIVLTNSRAESHTDEPNDSRRDPLTQLPDRNFLLSRLSTLFEGERAADRKFAVLFVDLNNFKRINDEHGHLLGDRVLSAVASRLSDCVRHGDHVTRFGGDEFVVLLERVECSYDIDPVVARIHEAFAQPIVLAEGDFQLSLSIGVARAAPHHRSAEDVLREADREMYAAKRATN